MIPCSSQESIRRITEVVTVVTVTEVTVFMEGVKCLSETYGLQVVYI